MSSEAEPSLCFVSWNTCGIRSPPQKFMNLLSFLNELQSDVVFIQETHVGSDCYQILENVPNWNIYFTVYNPRSKGVAIMIKNKEFFKYICHDEDYNGGYIVLFCHLYGELYTLVNVYNHKEDRTVLDRLKNYLMDTAEGVLVIGGDFNTVLHPSFDRISRSQENPSALRPFLEDFFVSLNLRDTWSYKYPNYREYTCNQKESYSRIDMFFMHSDTMGRVCDISVTPTEISDHNPLVLVLRVQQQNGNNIPKVALFLDELEYDRKPDRSIGKISGAEILSAIKSLADSEEQRPDKLKVDYYKRFQHPMSEILKINYNLILKNKFVPEIFKSFRNHSGSRHIFNVDYLIFSGILARRLNVLITCSLKGMVEKPLLIVTFRKHQEIKSSFLKARLKELKQKPITFAGAVDILDCLLPRVQHFSGEVRPLRTGCPLTISILNLALKNLEDRLYKSKNECVTSICFHRQALLIQGEKILRAKVVTLLKEFRKESGIKLIIRN